MFFLRRKIDKYSDKYLPYLFIMTIKLFIFDAARIRETRTRWQKTCVVPSSMQIHVRSAFSKLLAPCHSTRIWYPATLSSIWPIQIHGYSDSRSFRRFFPSLVHDLRHCRQRRRVFFCNTLPPATSYKKDVLTAQLFSHDSDRPSD